MSVRHGFVLREMCACIALSGWGEGWGGLEMSSKHDPSCFRWEWAAAEVAVSYLLWQPFPEWSRAKRASEAGEEPLPFVYCCAGHKSRERGLDRCCLPGWFWWMVGEGSLKAALSVWGWRTADLTSVCQTDWKRLLFFSFFHPGVLAFAKITCSRGLQRKWTALRMLKNKISFISSFLLSLICPIQYFDVWHQTV